MKLFWAGMSQRLYETAVAVLGPDALLVAGDEHAIDRGRWAPSCWRRAPTRSWAGRARSSATSSVSACSVCPASLGREVISCR